ncbi:MAG: hypothetical protein ABJF04_13060 [Reichenbachiella sp.]|uniref:hypothetical protein n=1 Tax=Reichenbachiella sp. TaxID=2184521 RepID=UPI00326420A0
MKQHKRKREIIGDHIYFLSHELRRPLANFVEIFEILKSDGIKEKDRLSHTLLLKRALDDFDKVLIEYNRTISEAK